MNYFSNKNFVICIKSLTKLINYIITQGQFAKRQIACEGLLDENTKWQDTVELYSLCRADICKKPTGETCVFPFR